MRPFQLSLQRPPWMHAKEVHVGSLVRDVLWSPMSNEAMMWALEEVWSEMTSALTAAVHSAVTARTSPSQYF